MRPAASAPVMPNDVRLCGLLASTALALGKAFVHLRVKRGIDAEGGTLPRLAHIRNQILYHLFTTLTAEQLQAILPAVIDSYRIFCWCRGLPPNVDTISTPSREIPGCWLGNPDAASTWLVFLHGGAFVMPGTYPHFSFLMRLVRWSAGRMAVFCPAYDLAPAAVYPCQIGQATEALRYVLGQRSPSSILLGGDSAGGNLVLAVLSHLAHPHPSAHLVRPLRLDQPLRGAFVIGPWISTDDRRPDAMHGTYDVVNVRTAQTWMRLYQGDADGVVDRAFLSAEAAPSSWWGPVADHVEHVLATAGSLEVLRPSIEAWAKRYQQAAGRQKLELWIGPGETHDAPLWADPEAEGDASRSQEAAVRRWMLQRISPPQAASVSNEGRRE